MTRKVFLFRDTHRQDVTLGEMITDRKNWYQILERPWINNQSNISCIPAGTYQCEFMTRSGSGKYRNVYWVRGIPGRSGILIHSGNVVDHTLGCLIIGERRGELAGKPAVLSSKTALRHLVDDMGKQPFELTIVEV